MATELAIGDRMEDGTIYAGLSPNTGRAMYAAPADAPLCLDFNEAARYAQELVVGDKHDFRVPSKAELSCLFNVCKDRGAFKGAFDLSGTYPRGWYWSGTGFDETNGYCTRPTDAWRVTNFLTNKRSVRCIRG
ncbi:MAG: hypothetical protein HY052_02130 [Proteobacteria bacterium]|nr:hypothetical protein [Pseudomonadota bacterium]